ncbi:kinase-like domain-containing protein [Gloeopeniophorella convolvens]|nr:kinase-like domain-containing protein [Gloeopeniophorella convolvens]
MPPPPYSKTPPRKHRRIGDTRAPLSDMSNGSALAGVLSPPPSPPSPPMPQTPTDRAFASPPDSPTPKPRGNARASPLCRVRSYEEDTNDAIPTMRVVPRRTPPPPYSLRSQNRHSSYIPPPDTKPGPFHMLECVQSGGYATAWAARDVNTSRVICLKVTSKKTVTEYKASRLALERELEAYQRLAACIETPYVMQLHGVFQDQSRVYFAMDLMECDLWEATAKGLTDAQLRRWTAQIALGLDALHNMGIMHRDMKPENILLSRAGDARIADLGAAYVHDASRLTRGQSYARDAVFTPGYAAPELVGSALREDGAWIAPGARCPRYGLEVDWWALGCIVYMMMAGCMLFVEKTDLLEYVERYRANRGRAWLRSRCDMSDNEARVLYGLLHVSISRRFDFEELEKEPFFDRDDGVDEFTYLEHRARSSLKGLYRPEKAKYRLAPSRSTLTLDLVSSTDDAPHEETGDWSFWRWFAWYNPQGLWAGWRGERRWWALH